MKWSIPSGSLALGILLLVVGMRMNRKSSRAMKGKIELKAGQTLLVIAKDGEVLHYTWDMALPHVEFVRRCYVQHYLTRAVLDNVVEAVRGDSAGE